MSASSREPGQLDIRLAVLGRRQVMVARTLVAQRAVDDNEVRWSLHRSDLASRSHTDEKPAARREQLFGDQDRKRGANGAADDAVFAPFVMKPVEIRVVAGPTGMAVSMPGSTQVPHDVAIWIENTDFRDGGGGQTFLASRFAQQVLWCKGRRGAIVLMRQDRWHSCFAHWDNPDALRRKV